MVTEHYSGILINQNATPTAWYPWRTNGAGWLAQTFYLPNNFKRGNVQAVYPDLSGFQVLVAIDPGYASAATLDYRFEVQTTPQHWTVLSKGTAIGAHLDGAQVWFDVHLPKPVQVTPRTASALYRFSIAARKAYAQPIIQPVASVIPGAPATYVIDGVGYKARLTEGQDFPLTIGGQRGFLFLEDTQVYWSIQQGISAIAYVQPSVLVAPCQAYNGSVPLIPGTTSSFDFRILALTADDGTDVGGNPQRAVVLQADGSDETNGPNYWMSPPQPSKFAVLSHYYDVRPAPGTPNFTLINWIGHPSFEYDTVGAAPTWWTAFASGGTTVSQVVSSTWATTGAQSLHMQYTFTASGQQRGILSPAIVVNANAHPQISVSAAVNINTINNASMLLSVLFYDGSNTLLQTSNFSTTQTGQSTISGTANTPSTTATIKILISVLSIGSGSFDGYADTVQMTFTPEVGPYGDGDQDGWQWLGVRGQSPSARLDTWPDDDTDDDDNDAALDLFENTTVVDGVMIDPLMPNMSVNVYYSNDDAYTNDDMTESDWEQKLWTHIPKTFICNQRAQYAFPHPVSAKYMKLEFTNLPARTYNVGNFAKPVSYKKFPTWVANYFIAQMERQSFASSEIAVDYNALQFAYDYFLDDLIHTPLAPSVPAQDASVQLSSDYFNPTTAGIDQTTLDQIDLTMNIFKNPAGSNANTTTLLGQYVYNLVTTNATAPTSGPSLSLIPTLDLSTVSSISREPVLFEQSQPVMYFFLTCRHGYRELSAQLEHNRAYFAGVRDVSFIRNDYTVAADTDLYIETGLDSANTEFTDFVIDTDKNWYAY